MPDGSFLRWPLAATDIDGAAERLLEGVEAGDAFRLVSIGEPAEAAIYAPAALVARQDGAMRYTLNLVSDSGPPREAAGIVMLVAFDVPPDLSGEVDRWYEEEHIPLLLRADGWLRARRYRVAGVEGGPRWTSLAFHELRDLSVMESPERAFARSTAWRAALEEGAWFRNAGRGVFRPLAQSPAPIPFSTRLQTKSV